MVQSTCYSIMKTCPDPSIERLTNTSKSSSKASKALFCPQWVPTLMCVYTYLDTYMQMPRDTRIYR